MKLRRLEQKDARLMLAWMHDKDVVEWLSANFASKKIEDCEMFIEKSNSDNTDLHLAIVNDNDIYMGTVSLKHINYAQKTAEFAITVRKEAMGQGYSTYGMKEILKIGLYELGLEKIYWCVSKRNYRAIRFYDKNKYNRIDTIPSAISKYYKEYENNDLIWYMAEK